MMKNMINRLVRVSILLFLVVNVSCNDKGSVTPEVPEKPTDQTLKEKANFGIGAAIKSSYLLEDDYSGTLIEHFDQISAEYEMKMEIIWKASSTYDWSKANELVDFAVDNDMKVHGHTLLWYRSFPEWFKNSNYDSVTFESKIKEYITTVVSRYKGTVISWDVANEIFTDNGTLREETVYGVFQDPIAFYGRCFQYARDADPDAKLFYNDYSVVVASPKRYAIKQMVERFENEGYPIDGIGDQFHYKTSTNETTMREGLTDIANTGLLIHISELDITVNLDKSDSYNFNSIEQQKQADKYQIIVEMYEELPEAQKFAITTWGITDKYTWLSAWWHEKEYPLLFDENYNKKDAYDGFLKGLN